MRHIIIALLIAVATNVMAQEKKLKVYGILSRYSQSYQLQLRSKDDVIELNK